MHQSVAVVMAVVAAAVSAVAEDLEPAAELVSAEVEVVVLELAALFQVAKARIVETNQSMNQSG